MMYSRYQLPAILGLLVTIITIITLPFLGLKSQYENMIAILSLVLLLISFGISNYMRVLEKGSIYDQEDQLSLNKESVSELLNKEKLDAEVHLTIGCWGLFIYHIFIFFLSKFSPLYEKFAPILITIGIASFVCFGVVMWVHYKRIRKFQQCLVSQKIKLI